MKRYLAFAIVALGLLSQGTAFGLSCMEPDLDETVIDGAVMIFEGTAGPKRPLDSGEQEAILKQGFGSVGGGTRDLRVYAFTVTRGWKGTMAGQSVDVFSNTYWGDHFAEGESYLVVSPLQVGDLFASPLCGTTVDLKYAAERGFLATLERVIGGGN